MSRDSRIKDDFAGLVPSLDLYDFENKSRNARDYVEYMLNRTLMMFEYDGLPSSIPRRNLELMLQTHGYVGIIKHNDMLYAVEGALGGVPDAYNMPTKFIVANPYLKLNKEYTIGEDCVIMKNDSMYKGLMPLLLKYASKLVENDLSILIANINTRITTILTAGDTNTQKSAEQFLEDVKDGKLGVITEPKFIEELVGLKVYPGANNSGNNNTIMNLIEYEQYLKGSWFMDLGVKAPFNMKREALGDSENKLQDDSLLPLVDDMLRCRNEAIEEIKEMFDEDIEVSFASAWENLEITQDIQLGEVEQEEPILEDEPVEEIEQPEDLVEEPIVEDEKVEEVKEKDLEEKAQEFLNLVEEFLEDEKGVEEDELQ